MRAFLLLTSIQHLVPVISTLKIRINVSKLKIKVSLSGS